MHRWKSFDIAILAAVSQEIGPLVPLLESEGPLPFLGQNLWAATLGKSRVLLATTGLGKVNAAAFTAALLQRFSIAQVWNIGSAGCYAEGPLEIGDVLVTLDSLCGDEGVLEKGRISSVSGIGIPIAMRGERVLHDRIHLNAPVMPGDDIYPTPSGTYTLETGSSPPVARPRETDGALSRKDADGFPMREDHGTELGEATGASLIETRAPDTFALLHGPSLTVGMSSGDAETASQRFRRYGAFAENMEGSAIAQTCFLFDVPMGECRGISNVAGDRNRDHWRLPGAIDHCHGIVLNWLLCHSSREGP